MSKTVFVTTGGCVPSESEEFCEEITEMDRSTLNRLMPQMLDCLFKPMVPQIEDPEHLLNGWQVNYIIIENHDEFDFPEDPDDPEIDQWDAQGDGEE